MEKSYLSDGDETRSLVVSWREVADNDDQYLDTSNEEYVHCEESQAIPISFPTPSDDGKETRQSASFRRACRLAATARLTLALDDSDDTTTLVLASTSL
jgi:hypothetical protein